MSISPFTGVGTALVTPFKEDGSVDHKRFADFVDWQITEGINFIVPLGTTGESVTTTDEEDMAIARTALEAANGRVPVLVGCGSNNTAEVIARAKGFKEVGVTHVLSVSPYYNKPSQEGIYQHFKALRQETGLGIMLYNIQGRTGSNVEPETIARLVEDDIIFGIKEASGSIVQIQKICQLTQGKLQVFSGDDALTQAVIAVGGEGVVCTSSNAIPKAMVAWVDTIKSGDYAKASQLLRPLLPLFEAMFSEPNPIATKAAVSLLGHMDARYRLPIVPPQEKTVHLLRELMRPFYSHL